ncbi:phosphodiesterase [Haematococcus lacustris]|uniref:Phosphodiesterase n=1 Tax=Haematococcus lacustris TaxID=44745 RepID=A0A699ZNK6_HAELA|nr:phosphodiesterase [Haematococcus lacustris]
MFLLSGLVASFGLSVRTLRAFITTVLSHYHAIPYHNFCHVCHVLHAVFLMLMTSSAAVILPAEDKLALMIAALCHDIDHDGYSNSFHGK